MKQHFQDWKPSAESVSLLLRIDEVLSSYEQQGYKLTLRQLYYQLVARDLISNTVESYGKLGNILSRGRLSGQIDWAMIEDRVRVPRLNTHWDSPAQIVEAAANSYYESRWTRQDSYVELWCEKDAVSNILEPVCRRWDVLFLANRGYSSQTAMYDSYKRLLRAICDEKQVRVLYFGDHDPSGIDMANDIKRRLGLFLYGEGEFEEVDRIALTMEQIEEYGPPENPAKVTDPRYENYAALYGESSWELDALEPSVLENLATKAIGDHMDVEEFGRVEAEEKGKQERIRALIANL